MELHTNDAIFFQYNKVLPGERASTKLEIKVLQCPRAPLNWHAECHDTVKYIKSKSDKPIMIAFSGGIDSEVVCRAFLNSKIDFSVFTLKYSDGSNSHDTEYADKFCKQYGIHQHIHLIDFNSLYGENLNRYVSYGFLARDIFRYLQLYLIEQIDNLGYTPVLGGGEQVYVNIKDDIGLYFQPDFLNSIDFCEMKKITAWPYFFMTRPENVASYLQEQLILDKAKKSEFLDVVDIRSRSRNASINLETSHVLKRQVYTKYYIDMEFRPKYNGFEYNDEVRSKLRQKFEPKVPINGAFLSLNKIKNSFGI